MELDRFEAYECNGFSVPEPGRRVEVSMGWRVRDTQARNYDGHHQPIDVGQYFNEFGGLMGLAWSADTEREARQHAAQLNAKEYAKQHKKV